MISMLRPVTVHQVPGQITAVEEKVFLRELQNFLEVERPRLVLDCSQVQRMDNATMYLLLCCLEEAMKRKGDVKLASLRPGTAAALQSNGVHRLFEIYSTTAEAVASFRQHSIGAQQPPYLAEPVYVGRERVA